MYTKDRLSYWKQVAARHHIRDSVFIRHIAGFFRPGPILEVGAGCGQLSSLLSRLGFEVMAIDLEPFFVDHMREMGLRSQTMDVMDIPGNLGGKIPNILTQGLTPLISTDLTTIRRTYRSIQEALVPGGRFVFIFPNAYNGKGFSRLSDHRKIIEATGFKIVSIFRHQILPPRFYTASNSRFLDFLDCKLGAVFGQRHVVVLEKPE